MKLTHFQLRKRYFEFWEKNHSREIPPIPLVPKDDPTTLFTGSGMQQLVPYLLGEKHPLGTRLHNIQRSFRSQDIEEIGDNRHTTMFEMMGNWSLGDYFKQEQLAWFFSFLVDEMKLDPRKLYVTVFEGEDGLPRDTDSVGIWKNVFKKYGVEAEVGKRIWMYPASKNWWSRAGVPGNMPPGEPGGPDSEVFYEFGSVPHDTKYGPACHPNCDCGRFLEIGNSVFMQYKKLPDGTFAPLPKPNVDFGGGLERIIAAVENNPDIFQNQMYAPIVEKVVALTGRPYEAEFKPSLRVVADHLKAAVFLIKDGVVPSNKEQGYVLRRLLRRLTVKLRNLTGSIPQAGAVAAIAREVLSMYEGVYFTGADYETVGPVIEEEIKRFSQSIERGLREFEKKIKTGRVFTGKDAFDIYQSYGFPVEVMHELLAEKGLHIDRAEFVTAFNKHRDLSRTSSAGKFKGGLADHGEQTLKYHTATHLLHQALTDIMGPAVRQEGSNINGERLRFDFYSLRKPEPDEIKRISDAVNDAISRSLPVDFRILPKKEAETLGAKSFFREKYPDMVKVYFIGPSPEQAYSKEFCGGPHVKNTKEIGSFSIYKTEKIGSNLYRIYAK